MDNDLEVKKIAAELNEINQQLLNIMSSIFYCRSLIKIINGASTDHSPDQEFPNDN